MPRQQLPTTAEADMPVRASEVRVPARSEGHEARGDKGADA